MKNRSSRNACTALLSGILCFIMPCMATDEADVAGNDGAKSPMAAKKDKGDKRKAMTQYIRMEQSDFKKAISRLKMAKNPTGIKKWAKIAEEVNKKYMDVFFNSEGSITVGNTTLTHDDIVECHNMKRNKRVAQLKALYETRLDIIDDLRQAKSKLSKDIAVDEILSTLEALCECHLSEQDIEKAQPKIKSSMLCPG